MIVNKKQWDNAFEGVKNLKHEEIRLRLSINTLISIPWNEYQ